MSKADELLRTMRFSPGVIGLYYNDDEGASQLLRDIAEELGLSWEMAEAVRLAWKICPSLPHLSATWSAIATILEAAGVEP